MKILLTFCLIIVGTDAVTTVTGHRGRSVQIKCPYKSGYEDYKKYLCRGKCPTVGYKDIPVRSGSAAKDTRFSLYDDTTAKVFTVTITDLRPEDEGTYWCAIERTLLDIYREILLKVKTDDPVISTVSHSTHTTHSASAHFMSPSVHAESAYSTAGTPLNSSNHPISVPSSPEFPTFMVIIVVSVVLVLLLIALSFAVTLQRKKKTQASSPAHSPQCSSNNRVISPPESRCLSNTLYSTAQLPTIPPDFSQSIYSNTGLPTDPSVYSQSIYASVQRPSDSPDQDIYSTAQLPTILSDSSASAAQPLVVKSGESPTYAAVSIDSGSNGAAVTVIFKNENSSCDYAIVNVT